MSFRGALLKPSEKGQTRVSKSARSFSTQSRYEALKEKVRTWWNDRSKVGAALQEIRDQKLYQHEHETFEDFCKAEYGFERAHAYRLIGFAEVKATVEMSPIGDKLQKESQARALAAVPAEKRVEVLEAVAERGSVTAKAITEAAKTRTSAPKPEKIINLDKTNYSIPEDLYEDWQRAEAFNSNLRELSRIKSEISRGLENEDLIFREINSSAV